jgi:hypothetical protein
MKTVAELDAERQTGRTTKMLKSALSKLRAKGDPWDVVVVMLTWREVDHAKAMAHHLGATPEEIKRIRWIPNALAAERLCGAKVHLFADHRIADEWLYEVARRMKRAR